MNTIKVMPNQSIPDLIIQGCGSLEAGMQFCLDNDVSLSDYPDIGDSYQISKEAITKGDAAVLEYLHQNGLVIGTMGPAPILDFRILLKPVMQVVPTDPDPPTVTGHYSYDFKADPGAFINYYPIAAGDYPSLRNYVQYVTEDRFLLGIPSLTVAENAPSLVMSDMLIPYQIPWVIYRGFMMVWSDLGADEKTVTFVDNAGNRAYVAPMIVLDNVTQNVAEYLIADLDVELISTARNTVKLRLTRSHPGAGHVDFATHVMSWLNDAAGGEPDPLDPGNADKTILTLTRGRYAFGIGTVYWNLTVPYPASAFSMVVEVF